MFRGGKQTLATRSSSTSWTPPASVHRSLRSSRYKMIQKQGGISHASILLSPAPDCSPSGSIPATIAVWSKAIILLYSWIEFYRPGVQAGHPDSLSLLHSVWSRSWEDSGLESGIILRHLHPHIWQLMLIAAGASAASVGQNPTCTRGLFTWPGLPPSMAASGQSDFSRDVRAPQRTSLCYFHRILAPRRSAQFKGRDINASSPWEECHRTHRHVSNPPTKCLQGLPWQSSG